MCEREKNRDTQGKLEYYIGKMMFKGWFGNGHQEDAKLLLESAHKKLPLIRGGRIHRAKTRFYLGSIAFLKKHWLMAWEYLYKERRGCTRRCWQLLGELCDKNKAYIPTGNKVVTSQSRKACGLLPMPVKGDTVGNIFHQTEAILCQGKVDTTEIEELKNRLEEAAHTSEEAAHTSDENMAKFHCMIGEYHLSRENFTQAYTEFEKAFKKEPKNHEILLGLARCKVLPISTEKEDNEHKICTYLLELGDLYNKALSYVRNKHGYGSDEYMYTCIQKIESELPISFFRLRGSSAETDLKLRDDQNLSYASRGQGSSSDIIVLMSLSGDKDRAFQRIHNYASQNLQEILNIGIENLKNVQELDGLETLDARRYGRYFFIGDARVRTMYFIKGETDSTGKQYILARDLDDFENPRDVKLPFPNLADLIPEDPSFIMNPHVLLRSVGIMKLNDTPTSQRLFISADSLEKYRKITTDNSGVTTIGNLNIEDPLLKNPTLLTKIMLANMLDSGCLYEPVRLNAMALQALSMARPEFCFAGTVMQPSETFNYVPMVTGDTSLTGQQAFIANYCKKYETSESTKLLSELRRWYTCSTHEAQSNFVMILGANSEWEKDCEGKSNEDIQELPLFALSRMQPKLYADIRKFVFYTVMALSTSLVPPQQKTRSGVAYFDNEARLSKDSLHQLDPSSPWVLHMREKAGEILQYKIFKSKFVRIKGGFQQIKGGIDVNLINSILKTNTSTGRGSEDLCAFLNYIWDGIICARQVGKEYLPKHMVFLTSLPVCVGNILLRDKQQLLDNKTDVLFELRHQESKRDVLMYLLEEDLVEHTSFDEFAEIIAGTSEAFIHKSEIAAKMLDFSSKCTKKINVGKDAPMPAIRKDSVVSDIKKWLLFGPIPDDNSMLEKVDGLLYNLENAERSETILLLKNIQEVLQQQMKLTSFPKTQHDRRSPLIF